MTDEARAKAVAAVRANAMDDKAVGLLLEMRNEQAAGFRRVDERMASFAGQLGKLEGAWDARPCPLHQQELRDLGTKIGAVDARVDSLHAKDLPELRQAMAVQSWWRTKAGKLAIGLLTALAAILSGATATLVNRALEAPSAKAAIPSVITMSPDKAPNSPFGAFRDPGATTSPDVFPTGLDGQVSGPVPQDGEDR